MSLITLIRIIFLVSLGIHLLSPNRPCQLTAGVTSVILGVLVFLGRF